MANIIQQANLEIERAKSISDQRAEAFRVMKAAFDSVKVKQGSFQNELNLLLAGLERDDKWNSWVGKINRVYGGFASALTT